MFDDLFLIGLAFAFFAAGVAFADLRNRVRLRLARAMLTETRMPVTQIALHLGYSETSAFTRAFKAMTGRSPAAFRAA